MGGLVSLGKTDNKASRFVPNHVLEHAMMKDRWQWPQFLSPLRETDMGLIRRAQSI